MTHAPPTHAYPDAQMEGVRLGRAARVDAAIETWLAPVLTALGWRPQLVPYPSYGCESGDPEGTGWVRVLARALLLPPRKQVGDSEGGRGWRRFITVAVPGTAVQVDAGAGTQVLHTDRGGYLDAVVPAALTSGWHSVDLRLTGSTPEQLPVRVVGRNEQVGVVSDIDDTVIVTALPQPLVAAWNTFFRREASRTPVSGMADFLTALLSRRAQNGAERGFIVYLSTGAWNVAPSLRRFLRTHGFPPGPLLLTDWGPTADRLFRSGRGHKRDQLRRLAAEFPHLTWTLVGDDGQHDPSTYDEFAAQHPNAVDLVAIRELSSTEQLLTHLTPRPPDREPPVSVGPGTSARWIRAADGYRLHTALATLDDHP